MPSNSYYSHYSNAVGEACRGIDYLMRVKDSGMEIAAS